MVTETKDEAKAEPSDRGTATGNVDDVTNQWCEARSPNERVISGWSN